MPLDADLTAPLPRLMFITDAARTAGRELAKVVELVCEGGCRLVQVRAPGLPDREYYLLARQLTHIANAYGALAIINDRIDICHAVGAQGVHLGASDLPLRVARQLLGPGKLLGYSAHSYKELRRTPTEGADYCTFSPIFPLAHKESGTPPWGIAGLREALLQPQGPVFALGGIQLEHVPVLVADCADAPEPVRIAVSSLLGEAERIRETASDVLRMLHPELPPDADFAAEARYIFEPDAGEDWDVAPGPEGHAWEELN